MTERPLAARARDSSWVLLIAVATVVGCWILGNPRSSGPDEPSHMVTSAALVRGERNGIPDPLNSGVTLFELPGMVGAPDPACWTSTVGFDPNVPVGCENELPLTSDEFLVPTTSENYPPWGFILPGLASFVPGVTTYAYLARGLNALVPIALVTASLVVLRRRRPIAALTALLGLTPIAWFTFGVVNPSATVIAGGLALWTGLLYRSGRWCDALVTAGWVAVILPRRDGPVWATLIVLTCCWMLSRRPGQLLGDLRPWARTVVLIAALLPTLTPLANGEHNLNLALSLATLALVVVELIARMVGSVDNHTIRRAVVGGCVIGVAGAAIIAVTLRPGGFRAETVRLVMSGTGEHLHQLVGVLGWLSTPVPVPMVLLQWVLLGGLGAVAYVEYRRAAVIGAVALGATIVTAWVLELGQGSNYGRYWHGRYSMPLAVGLPLLLAWRARGSDQPSPRHEDPVEPREDPTDDPLVTRLVPVIAVGAWTVANVAFIAAQQRWAVGVDGSWYPWDWNTWSPPIWPPVLVVLHALATGALTAWCARPGEPPPIETDSAGSVRRHGHG